jgi:hypothetical protein
MQIRHTHPDGFRCGEWAQIHGVDMLHGRLCYRVSFPDGEADLWAMYDPDEPYEFRENTDA